MVNGKMELNMVKVFILVAPERNIMENGKKDKRLNILLNLNLTR